MPAKLSQETVLALLAEKNWEPVDGWEYVNVDTPIPGRCIVESCGYEGPGPRYSDLKQGRGACKECASLRGGPKAPESEVNALLAEKKWKPTEGWEYLNRNAPIPGRCLVEGCGYEGPGPRYDNLKNGTGACKRCSGSEKTSDEVVRALLAEKDWEPVDGWGYLNKDTPIPGRCLVEGCGYEGPGPQYGSLRQGRGACPSCAENGYNPAKHGWFYRFEFIDRGQTFLCYGITNYLDARLKQYERKLDVQNSQSLHFEDGAIPQEIEKKFHEIRKESSVPASTCGVNGTVTESFSLSPENWELLTVFEAHWADAVAQASLEATAA